MSETFKISGKYLNPYEEWRDRLVNNIHFDSNIWRDIAQGKINSTLDEYITALTKSDEIITDVNKYNEEYALKYADDETRLAALYNEVYGSKSNLVTMERYVKNSDGTVLYKDAKPVTEKYTTSEYEYYKESIKEANMALRAAHLRAIEEERKDSMSGFSKFLHGTAAVGMELASGVTSVIDGVTGFAGGVSEAIDAISKGKDVSDAFVKGMADDDYRAFSEFQDYVVNFESNYTDLRDLDGNYTNLGKYLGGISYTVGQMLPSILITLSTGGLGGAIGGTFGSFISTTGSVASQTTYYGSMAVNNAKEIYEKSASEGLSITSEQILANVALKTTLEIGIEKVLGKLAGGTSLDNVVFGRSVSAGANKTLVSSGTKRILKDAAQEGFEEVLQEISGFLTDALFTVRNENFSEISDLTFQSLLDAFIIGSIVSFGGSALGVLKSSSKSVTADTSKSTLGRKIAAYEYKYNLKSFVEAYNTFNKNSPSKGLFVKTRTSMYNKSVSVAATKMYSSYRMIASIYGEIGEKRFKIASKVLDKIQSDIDNGKYDADKTRKRIQSIYDTVFDKKKNMSKEYQKYIEKRMEEAKVTIAAELITQGEDLPSTIKDDLAKEITDIMDSKPELKNLQLVEDGVNVVNESDAAIVPKNLLKNAGAKVVLKSMSENDFVKSFGNSEVVLKYKSLIVDTYVKITGNKTASYDEIIRSLILDPNLMLFKTLLLTSNTTMYSILTSLPKLVKSQNVGNKIINRNVDGELAGTINTTYENMRKAVIEYLKNQPNANYNLDFISDSDKRLIEKYKWCKNIYSRVIRGEKLSKDDLEVLNNRINYLPISDNDKKKLLKGITSSEPSVRASSMNFVDEYYKKIFTTKYDGKTLPPRTNIPNIVFSNFLEKLNLTLENVLDETKLSDEDVNIINDTYGKVNFQTILEYRRAQFSTSVNGMYNLHYDGKFTVTDENGKRVGYSNYSKKIDNIVLGDDIFIEGKKVERTIESPDVNGTLTKNIVKALIRKDVDDVTKQLLSINDLVYDPTLLNESVVESIKRIYTVVNPETAFMYLRQHILEDTGNISISITQDNDVIFVNTLPMVKTLIKKNNVITKNCKASEIFDPSLLHGMLSDLHIVLTDEPIVAEYRPMVTENINGSNFVTYDNAIFLNRDIAKKGGNVLDFALAHEFQHAIQFANRMNLGLNKDFFTTLPKDVKDSIINSFKKHKPDLFYNNPDSKVIENRISEFIYHTSNESAAMGMNASTLVDFYPTIVKSDRTGTVITLSWGDSFNISNIALNGVKLDDNLENIPMNKHMLNNTKDYPLEKMLSKPKTCFIAPDGTYRLFDGNSHYDFIKSIDEDVNRDYWDSIPQVTVEDGFATIKVPTHTNNNVIASMLALMDYFYDNNTEFMLDSINYEDVSPNSVTVFSNQSDNSDNLLTLYSNVVSSQVRESRDTDLGSYIPGMSLAKVSPENKVSTTRNVKYVDKIPVKNDKGEIIRYKYKYSDKRYVNNKLDKDDPLQAFRKKGKPTQLSSEMQIFISSTKGKNIANSLRNKINDGTLTSSDVMDWISTTSFEDMDEVTFGLINKAFFRNDNITSVEDFKNYVINTAYYYGAKLITEKTNNDSILRQINPDVTKALVESYKNSTDTTVGKLLTEASNKYYYVNYSKDNDVDKTKKKLMRPRDIDEGYLRRSWLRYYDGSLLKAGEIANIVRSATTSKMHKIDSLEKAVGEDMTLQDVLEDKSALQDIWDLAYSLDRDSKVEALRTSLSVKMIKLVAEKYGTGDKTAKTALELNRIISTLPKENLNELYVKQMLCDVLGIKFDTLENEEFNNIASDVIVTPYTIHRNMMYHIGKIKRYLPEAEKKLFLKTNSDIFNDDLKLRDEVYKHTDSKGRLVYNSVEDLQPIFDRIVDLAEDVKNGAYRNKQVLNQIVKSKKAAAKVQEETVKKLQDAANKAKTIVTLNYQVAGDYIQINTTKPRAMPAVLNKILDYEFNKMVQSNRVQKSKTKYLTDKDSHHLAVNMDDFLEANAEILNSLTQQDVNDIVDFYLVAAPVETADNYDRVSAYRAVQLYLSTFLLKGNRLGWWTLDEERVKAFTKVTELRVHSSALDLAIWREVKEQLNPERIFISSFGITIRTEDAEKLSQAVKTMNVEEIAKIKKVMLLHAIKDNKDNKTKIQKVLDKIYNWEKLAMLSGPGTALRGVTSNTIVTLLNPLSERLGSFASKLIRLVRPKNLKDSNGKLLIGEDGKPKTSWQRKGQYKFIGTKVDKKYHDFIQSQLLDNGLLKELGSAISGYNLQKVSKKSKSRDVDMMAAMIEKAISTDVIHDTFKISKDSEGNEIVKKKLLHTIVFGALSDDPFINKRFVTYLGKMLTEDNVDVNGKVAIDIQDYIAEAYKLASEDYMHSSNFWNKIDNHIRRNAGPVGYFAYKQVFPFASTSYNWFKEFLWYSPLGLIKSVIRYANLESYVDKLDKARQEGKEDTISSKFAEYTTIRNIGKGVIGSIGTLIGILLVALGKVKLREEEDKYVISSGDVQIDITEVFGTQSIFMAMTVGQLITDMNADNEEFDLLSVIAKSCDSLLNDFVLSDVWNNLRRNNTLGDYVSTLPMQILNNMIPNFFKTISNILYNYEPFYNSGLPGKIEKLMANAIPGLLYVMPKQVDIYTGENQIMYKAQFITELSNRLLPYKVYPFNVSDLEKLALDMDINKTNLNGSFTIDGVKYKLTAKEISQLNEIYGKYNNKYLTELINYKISLKVRNDNGTNSTLKWSKMSDKQKKSAFGQIMSENAQYAKVYVLTQKGYKYYASNSEYIELRKLGITKNVYRKIGNKEGFVK